MIKKKIVDAMRILYDKKYITVFDGNISFKPKNQNYFYITAGSVKKNNMNEEQIIKVYFNNNKTTNQLIYQSTQYKPSREINLHSYLQTNEYYKDKDTYIVHAHPPNIISYVGIKPYKNKQLKNIQNVFPEINVGKIGENVNFHEAGTNELANDCLNKLLYNDIIALKNHGSLTIGEDMDKQIDSLDTLEFYINILFNSRR